MERVVSNAIISPDLQQYDLWEYLLVAHPDEAVNQKLKEEREHFFEQYKEKFPAKTRPTIVVASFTARESMEDTLIRWIHRVCSKQKSFPVTLNNYSGFPPHTIYLRVQDHQPFRQLASQLNVIDEYVQANSCPPVKFIVRPHLSLVRRLEEEVYTRAIFDYAQKDFHETFLLNELVLLRRHNEFDDCHQVNVFRLFPPDTNMHAYVA